MSELQRQLALARQGPAKADDKRALGKVKVASFMFEDRTAAELSIDDCFALGTEGLTELSEYDSRFLDYLGDLFSQAGKDTNRELQTKEVNAKLDQIIDDFFLLLGPYFLLKPAHKVIEYMVRRYKVHEYNVDSVMRCILPYHETLLFSRFVQLLRIAGTKWEFLAPIQTSGAPLFRDILVRRSRVDFSVMEFVCEMTKMAIATKKSSKTIVSFFGVVLMEFIGAEATGSAAITEDTLKRIFPYILNSIKNQDEKDYQLAGYMALTQVFSRFELSDDFLSTCIDRIVRNIVGEHKKSIKLSSDAIKEALMCLVFLFQSQRLDEFPPSAFHELLSSSELASTILSTLQALAQRYDVYNFMSLFLQSLVAMSVEKPSATFGLLETALKEMPELVERHVKNISSQLLDLYIEASHAKSKESEKASANINRILKVIDGRYPVELDKGVNERVKTLEDEGEKELILNFVQLTFAGTGHLIMKETQTSLFLSCEHPDPNIRLLAIKHLKKQLADGTATADTRRFAAATFLRHLLDEDPVVVSEVLSCPNLLSVLLFDSSSGAVDALFGKLASLHTQAKQKSSNESYATIRKQILELFAGQFLDAYPHLLEKIVPFVLDYLMLDPKLRELNQKVLTIASNVNYPLFSNIAPAKTAQHSSNTLSADEVQHNIQTIDAVARNLVADIEHLLPVCTSVLADGQHAQIFLVCVLNRALALLGSAKDGTQNQVKIASALFSFIREDVVNIPSSVTRARVAKALSDKSNAETTGLPSSAILSTISDSAESYSVLVLFTLLNILEALPTDAASSTNDEVNSLLQEIFIDVAMCNHPASLDLFQAHLGSLFKRHLKKKTLKFLSHFWTKEVMAVPTLVQVRALTLASLVISASKKPTDLQLIVPSLFIPLSSPIKSVRKVALDFVSVVAKVLPEEASTPAPHGFYPEVSDKSKSFSLAIPTNKLKSLLQRLTKETGQIMANATFLQSFLSKESSDKKIVHYLSSHVHAFDTIYPKLAMLHLLQDADDSHKLEVLHPLLNSLLDKSKKILEETQTSARISKEEKDLIGALLSLFTEESLRLLNERKSHEYFDTFLRALSFHQSVPYHNGDEDTQTKAAEPIPMNVDDSEEEEEEEEDNGDSTSSSTKRTALTGASTKRFVPALCVVSLVTPSFFQGLSVPLRHKLFASICDVLGHAHRRQGVHAGQTDSDIVTIKFKQVVKNLPLNAETILAGLPSALLPATSPDTAASTPKKRKDAAPVVQIDEAAVREAMHKLSTLLEVLQVAESAVADSHLLVKPLFNVLRAVTSQPFSIDSLAEYNLNLLIGILTDISDVSEPNNIEKLQSQSQHFDVDAVVGFLKESESAQTRNNALLLLGNMTRLFPKRCLAQIVPALTFMSQTLRRSDDSYTFSVIQKTLEMVVPKAAENGVSIKDIVHSFTTCVEYISIQFNVQLFCSLVSALSGSDVGQHLPSVIALLLEKYAKSGNKIEIPLTTEAADEEEECHVIPMICEALFKPFSATVRLSAMLQLLITVNKLLSQGEARASASMVFDSKDANEDQIRLFSTSVLALLIKHISSKEFIERVVDEPKDNKPVLEKLLGSFVETILVLTVDQAQLNRSSKAKQFLNETKGALYLLFEKINGLLSVGPFLKIIADLLTHKNIQVRIKAFELFNNRLTRESINIDKFEAQFLAMIPDIVRVIKSQSQDAEHALLKQSSIESMAVLTKKLGAKYPDQIAVVLPDLVPCLESAESTAEVMASSAICLATICAAIGVKSLGYLPKICPRLVAIVKESLLEENNDSKDCNQLLQLSILSSLEVFVIKMHKFMSPYLADITAMLLHKGLVESENAKVVEKTTALLRLLAMKIEARHLLEPLFAAYNSALLFGDKSLCLLFNTFGIAISAMDMETINAHYKRLFKFYLEQAIEIRHLHSSKVTDIEDVEKHMISSFMDLVLKLSENVFKPFFLKMVEWAYAAAADDEDSVVSHLNKSITFYHLVSATVKKLKSIFVPYFAYILQHCGTELKRLNRRGDSDDAEEDDSGDGVVKMVASASKNKNSNSKKSKSKRKHSNISSAVEEDTITKMKQQQICLILSCLSGCFKHDADGFMTDKSNNDAIVQPLVDLLSNTSVGGASAYQERVERYLIPCLINLIAAVGNDALWRPITYEVLQKTHSPNPVVRYSAAKTLLGFYEKMGEDFLVMLPETLPHLAELMEDDDARVEQITQELVKRIEALSGESVTQLLK